MKNNFGTNISMTIFGESHGPCIGITLDGLPAGFKINLERIKEDMEKRKAKGSISTQRHEDDEVEIVFVDRGQPLGRIRRNGRSSVAGGQHPRAGQQQEKCTVDFHMLVLLWFCRGSGRFRSPISDPA